MRMRSRYLAVAIVFVALLGASCVRVTIPSTVKRVSVSGTHIMMTVQAMATAVEQAEEQQRISRNNAIKVMVTLSKVTDAAEQLVKYLSLIPTSDSPTELSSTVDKVIAVLDAMNEGLFQAFVPIQDEALKASLGKLAVEVGQTITIINREILGRAYAKAK